MPRVGFRFAGSRVWKLEFVIQTKPTRVDSGSIWTMKKIKKSIWVGSGSRLPEPVNTPSHMEETYKKGLMKLLMFESTTFVISGWLREKVGIRGREHEAMRVCGCMCARVCVHARVWILPKIRKGILKNIELPPKFIYWKNIEKIHLKRKWLLKLDFGFENQLRVGKILTSYEVC